MIQNWKFQRGDIFFTRFDNAIGSEQSGNRPAVVLQNDVGNFYSPTLIVATLTSKAAKKYTQPTHCLLVNDFLSVPSIVQAEQIFTVDKSRVLKFLGRLTPEEMSRVDDAVRASLALNPMGSIQRLPPIIRSTAAYAPPEVVDGKPPIYPYTPIKSSFEDAGSVEDMMLYTELEAAVHAMIQRLELRMMDGYQKDGSPRFKTFYGKTQKEVKLKLKEYQDALISGVQLDTILYFEDWADTWFEGHRDNIAPTTQESYKYCLKMLKEGFYHRPLTVIRPINIENFLKGMRRDGRSDSYISKARGMLYQIFQKAEANDLVRRNPVRLAEKMRASGTAKRKEAFTTAEVAHLMKVLPDDRMGLSIRLLLGTGMRMQELLALEPQFIEEDGSVIHIRQAVKVVKGTVSIGSPKSKDSIRDIPVPLNVRSCAIKLRDTTDQFIWESPKTGLPCNPTHFRDVFRKSLEEAGDVRLLTPHSCRHTYVSQMQALGVDIQTIQSIVGHADTEMTEHYLHVQESIRQSAIQLFSEAFSA